MNNGKMKPMLSISTPATENERDCRRKKPLTFDEAIKAGFYVYDKKKSYGYISRKLDIKNQIVKTAAGSRRGELYIEIPSYTDTAFFYRLYIRK